MEIQVIERKNNRKNCVADDTHDNKRHDKSIKSCQIVSNVLPQIRTPMLQIHTSLPVIIKLTVYLVFLACSPYDLTTVTPRLGEVSVDSLELEASADFETDTVMPITGLSPVLPATQDTYKFIIQ